MDQREDLHELRAARVMTECPVCGGGQGNPRGACSCTARAMAADRAPLTAPAGTNTLVFTDAELGLLACALSHTQLALLGNPMTPSMRLLLTAQEPQVKALTERMAQLLHEAAGRTITRSVRGAA